MKRNERGNKENKPVFFYPGRDNEYNLKAVPAHDSLIVGCFGTGKSCMVNHIIIQLMQQYSPNEVQIHVIKGEDYGKVDWRVRRKGKVDLNRIVPSIVYTGQTFNPTKGNYINNICDYIEAVAYAQYERMEEGYEVNELEVVICDDVTLSENEQERLKDVLRISNKTVVILALNDSRCITQDFVSLFKNRFCFQCSERTSELMLNSNIASKEFLDEDGVCYYYRAGSNTLYQKLWVPYMPASVVNKIIGAFSIRLSNESFAHVCKNNAIRGGEILIGILSDGVAVRISNFSELSYAVSALREIGATVIDGKLECDEDFEHVFLKQMNDGNIHVLSDDSTFNNITMFSKIKVV